MICPTCEKETDVLFELTHGREYGGGYEKSIVCRECRKAIRQRVGESRQVMRSYLEDHGKPVGRIPFGKTCNPNGMLVDCPEEMAVINKMITLYHDGMTCGQIAKRLNDYGYPSKCKKEWHHGTIRRILARFGAYEGIA